MLDELYEDIGSKIKNFAKWIFIIEAIGAIITGLVLLFTDESLILTGLLTLFFGPVIAWVSSWILYAFGKLVDDVEAIRYKEPPVKKIESQNTTKQPSTKRTQTVVKNEKADSQKAISKDAEIHIEKEQKSEQKEEPKNKMPCPQCGKDLAFMGWDIADLQENQICPMCGKEISFKQ